MSDAPLLHASTRLYNSPHIIDANKAGSYHWAKLCKGKEIKEPITAVPILIGLEFVVMTGSQPDHWRQFPGLANNI